MTSSYLSKRSELKHLSDTEVEKRMVSLIDDYEKDNNGSDYEFEPKRDTSASRSYMLRSNEVLNPSSGYRTSSVTNI